VLAKKLEISYSNFMRSRRNKVFINQRIQAWVMLTVVLVCLTSILVFGDLTYRSFRNTLEPWLHPGTEIAYAFEEVLYPMIDDLFLIGVPLFLVMSFALSLFLTHHIAGPLVQMQRVINDVRNGKTDSRVRLRRGDYITELADDFNKLLDDFEKLKNSKKAGN